MKRLEVSGAVRPLQGSLGVKELTDGSGKIWGEILLAYGNNFILVRFINKTEKNHVKSQSQGLTWLIW